MYRDLSLSDRARIIEMAVRSGITDLSTIEEVYNTFAEGGPKEKLIERINSTSDSNFVQRLKDPNREYIVNPNGSISTHSMAYVTQDGRAIVYPEVQQINGSLVRVNPAEALDSAISRRDTLMMSIPEAEWFTTNYKNYYPKGNTFGEGGRLYETGGPAGSIVPALVDLAAKKAKKKYLSDYAKSGYMYSYPDNPLKMAQYIVSPYMKTDNYGNQMLEDFDPKITSARRELFARYFNLNPNELGLDGTLIKSEYTPTNATDVNAKYYTLPGKDAVERMNNFSQVAGEYKVSLGEDKKGKYFSIYDVWDLSPFSGYGNEFKNTSPVELYDRIYENESPDLYKYFSESTDTHIADNKGSFSDGGKIHIKPENRGKFTALKKRTGHSASWFKAHGTPSQKKMATFALNARKWKHSDGGLMTKL